MNIMNMFYKVLFLNYQVITCIDLYFMYNQFQIVDTSIWFLFFLTRVLRFIQKSPTKCRFHYCSCENIIAIKNIDLKRKNHRPWIGAMEKLLDPVKRQTGHTPKVNKSPCGLQRKKKDQGKVLESLVWAISEGSEVQGSLSSAWPLSDEGKGW